MHGHALSGCRKLNRHWQSGSLTGSGSHGDDGEATGLAGFVENLVLFKKKYDSNTPDWLYSDSIAGKAPYATFAPVQRNVGFSTFAEYGKILKKRDLQGFRELSIIKPGNYKLCWDIQFRKVELVEHDGKEYWHLLGDNLDSDAGLFACIMYGAADPSRLQEPKKNVSGSYGVEYYVGGAYDYIADQKDSRAFINVSNYYKNDSLVKYVIPSRISTSDGFDGCNTWFNKSGDEIPSIILHIANKAPFYQYQLNVNTTKKEVYFSQKDFVGASPDIKLVSCFKDNIECIMTGKIWLERLGDYTPIENGWNPKILSVPPGYTIKGNGGLL